MTFIFVQAERSSHFETQKIGQTGFGVLDFFKDEPQLPRNVAVKDAAAIMTAVYERSSKFTRGNPNCQVYYVTTGTWNADANLEARRAAVVQDLTETNLFGEVVFSPVGADALQDVIHPNEERNLA